MTSPSTDSKEKSLLSDSWLSRTPLKLTMLAVLLAFLWERLFYGRPLGVSYPIWIGVALISILLWTRYEGDRFSSISLVVALFILLHALVVPWRVEPLTNFLAIAMSLALGLVWIRILKPGNLHQWGWLDYVVAGFLVPLEGLLRPWPTLAAAQGELTKGDSWSDRSLSVLWGLLLALPVVIVFLALLSSADLVFGDWVAEALAWLNLERLFEFLSRGFVILVLSVLIVGLVAAALRRSRQEPLVRDGKPLVTPFLGLTEAGIVLASVDAIFGLFVLVQFRYFFGGEANISAAGYTYAEYARRGFGELVAVSFLTLGLILLLGNWTRRPAASQRWWFRGLSGTAVAMTGVMLASAMARLQLYERAFGFTRLRSYTHVAIILLAVLFAAFMILLFMGRLRGFAGVCMLGAVGFSLALPLINIDAMIVERNYQHLEEIGELDGWYLTTLSNDAVPALVSHLDQTPEEELPLITASLACKRASLERRAEETGWPSYRWAHARARQALASIDNRLDEVAIEEFDTYSQVEIGPDEYFYCYDFDFIR